MWDIRKYLKEFLSDRRVIELNPLIWQIILNVFILTSDHQKLRMLMKRYGEKKDESPLLFFTRNQSIKLNK